MTLQSASNVLTSTANDKREVVDVHKLGQGRWPKHGDGKSRETRSQIPVNANANATTISRQTSDNTAFQNTDLPVCKNTELGHHQD